MSSKFYPDNRASANLLLTANSPEGLTILIIGTEANRALSK